MTGIGKPGAIYVSCAGSKDQFENIAIRLMMIERLTKRPVAESLVEYALGKRGLSTPENIEKVKAFFPADKVWQREEVPTEPEPAVAIV